MEGQGSSILEFSMKWKKKYWTGSACKSSNRFLLLNLNFILKSKTCRFVIKFKRFTFNMMKSIVRVLTFQEGFKLSFSRFEFTFHVHNLQQTLLKLHCGQIAIFNGTFLNRAGTRISLSLTVLGNEPTRAGPGY